MFLTNTLLALLVAGGASAQRGCRFGGCNTTPAPTPDPTPAPPPPPLGSTQSMWGQCGGIDWEYATACPTDAYCYNDGDNEWYSQCIPHEDDRPDNEGPPAVDPDIETRTITTIFDVPGPTPTVVTTYITIFTQAPEPIPPPPPPPVVTITAVPDTPIGRKRRWSA